MARDTEKRILSREIIWRSDGKDKIISRDRRKLRITVVLIGTAEQILRDCQNYK